MEDPRFAGPKPPFGVPPRSGDLNPKPDHGERTYVGCNRLEHYAAIVVGGDSGIGRAVAIAFAREGASVLIGYQGDREDAEETVRWISEAGRRAVAVPGDLRSDAYRQLLVERSIEEFGSLDVLVSDAPWINDVEDGLAVEEAIRSGQEAVFALSLLAADKMKPGAAIVATTLAQLEHAPSLQRAYAAYRGGVGSLTASLARELSGRGVRVNAVEPGPVWAPRMLAALTDEQVASFGANTLFGRPAQPAEMAPAYVFLASPAASFTGAVLPVTGGQLEPTPAKFAE